MLPLICVLGLMKYDYCYVRIFLHVPLFLPLVCYSLAGQEVAVGYAIFSHLEAILSAISVLMVL